MLRTLLERLTSPLVVKRRLPKAYGRAPMFVSSAGGLRYLFKPMSKVDPELLSYVDDFVKKDSVV